MRRDISGKDVDGLLIERLLDTSLGITRVRYGKLAVSSAEINTGY